MESSLIDRYITYVSTVRRYSSRTRDIYASSLANFCAYAGPENDDELVASLIPNMIRGYEVDLLDKGMKARTVNLHISVLSGFCRFLMKNGVIEANPVHMVRRPKMERRLPEFFREEDMRNYFRRTDVFASDVPDLTGEGYVRRFHRAVVSTLYNTGIRRSELVGLRRGDVDFSRQVMRVRGKGGKMREIPLTSSVCDEISLYLQKLDSLKCADVRPDAALLQTERGGRLYPVFVDRAVKKELGGVAGISGRKSPHVLRHTLATELLDNGADLNSIKELLGHSSLAATQVYTHNSIERLKNVYNNAHPRAKNGGNMEIKVKSLKFDAGERLTAFVEKKVSRLSKFFDGVAQEAEVVLEDTKDGKRAKIQIRIPGDSLIIDRAADTFENAITECVDAMKEKLTRAKEKKYEK